VVQTGASFIEKISELPFDLRTTQNIYQQEGSSKATSYQCRSERFSFAQNEPPEQAVFRGIILGSGFGQLEEDFCHLPRLKLRGRS
jgi:hypothetical protein